MKDDTQNQTDQIKQNQIDEVEEVSNESQENSEILEWKNKYLRALADYQNLERTTQSWKESFSSYAIGNFVMKLLDVVDDLDKAQEHLKDEGLALIISKLNKILKDEGLEEIKMEGQKYDPHLAEVISTVTSEDEEKDVCVKVLQKGYQLGDRVLRPAKVVVNN